MGQAEKKKKNKKKITATCISCMKYSAAKEHYRLCVYALIFLTIFDARACAGVDS